MRSFHRLTFLLASHGIVCTPVLALEPTGSASPVLDPVIVTASRWPQLLQTAPIGASIITAEQIERAGVVDANEAIRKLGGVVGKTDLSNGREYTLDLRGYGDTANQNIVVLVDGIRLSENELMAARLTAIPVEQIDRIEIVRGGASVSWGEGASAGVINVILKSGLQQRSSARISAAVESFGGRDVRASGLWAVAPDFNLEGSLRHLDTDGYRDNSDYRQKSGSLGLQWARQGWQIKARVQHEDNHSGLAGSLGFAQFEQNPRQASTPTDTYESQSTLYSTHVQYQSGSWTAAVDLGQKELSSYAYSPFYTIDADRTQRQVSPRLTYSEQWRDIMVSTTLGLDWQQWRYDEAVSGIEANQISRAAYLRSEFSLPSNTRLTAGVRAERVNKRSEGGSFSAPYDRTNSLKASEIAVSQTVAPGIDVYGRLASSYRLPNLDENGFTIPSADLRPQKNRDRELGVKVGQRTYSAAARWFKQTTVDEIALAPPYGPNINLDPTRRQGLELEGKWMPSRDWTLSATWQRLSAKYRSGPNAGKEQVLVAPRTATLRAAYRFDDRQTVDVGVQHLAAMRFYNDASNQCARRIPRSTLLDARYAWTDQTWTVAVSGSNLTDHKGYNFAYSCTLGSLYPEPGRLVRLTASRQF